MSATRPNHDAPPGTKWCYKCKAYHPFSDFGNDASQRDGHTEMCKAATRIRQSEYRARNRDRILAQDRKRRERMVIPPLPPISHGPPERGALVRYDGQLYRVTAVKDERVQLSNGAIIPATALSAA